MATLTIADLDNGQRDLQTVDAVANNPEDTTVTRFGDNVLTLAGALRRLGYAAPVEYAPGLSVDSGLFTVSRDGVIYAPQAELVPFITGAWDESQWRPVQNTENKNQVYQFETLAAAEAAANTLPDGAPVIVEGVSQGRTSGGQYEAQSRANPTVLEDYSSMTSFTGNSSLFQITQPGIAGFFEVDPSDTTSPSDGGTVFVLADGRRAKRIYDGSASIQWFGVTGSGNEASKVQSAFDAVNDLTISDITINATGDILYKAGFNLRIQSGAELIIDAGRITPRVSTAGDVNFFIDGTLRSTNLPGGAIQDGGPPGKFDWTVITNGGKQYAERAFVEFGGTSAAPANGFLLTGSGLIAGDWVGTPAPHTWDIMPRKGVGSWRADNVTVSNVEITGFRAECVYHEEQSRSAQNIIFENLLVHDVGHNGLNFNMAGIGINCHIRNNRVKRSYQGVEASSGFVTGNTLLDSVGNGIETGAGRGGGLKILGNTLNGSGGTAGIHAVLGTAIANTLDGKVEIARNSVINSSGQGIFTLGLSSAQIKDNTIDGFSVIPGDYPYGIVCLDGGGRTCEATITNNTLRARGASGAGWIYSSGPRIRSYDNFVSTPSGAIGSIAEYAGNALDAAIVQHYSAAGVPFSGFGFTSRYSVGIESLTYSGAVFAETNAWVLSAPGANAVGIYTIKTRKTSASDTPKDSLTLDNSGNWLPGADNAQDIGSASARMRVIYAGTGSINTSDGRAKQDVSELTEAEKRVAVRLKSLIRTYRFRDAVEEKKDSARIHCGIIAQDVEAAFTKEGLDPSRYALLCYDEWAASPEIVDGDGNVVRPAITAGNRYGVRYDELIAFIVSAI